MEPREKQLTQITLVGLLLFGCLLILYPFVGAILLAAVLCLTTWPIYEWILDKTRLRHGLAAGLMTVLLTLAVLLPLVFLAASAADGGATLLDRFRPWIQEGWQAPPAWLKPLPLIGEYIDSYWHRLAQSRDEFLKFLQQLYDPARKTLFYLGRLIGQGVLQVTLVLFVAYFFYRDGHALAAALARAARRLGGDVGDEMLSLTKTTIRGVMVGIVGTALAQAVVAVIGFVIAGVPAPLLLGAAIFFLSMVPIGPPLVWGGAAVWLYNRDEMGWAIFMVLYGLLAISSVDNFLKPWLISRRVVLPILLIALGVFGGILAFGFIGIFLGPTLLALGQVQVKRWVGPGPEDRPVIESA